MYQEEIHLMLRWETRIFSLNFLSEFAVDDAIQFRDEEKYHESFSSYFSYVKVMKPSFQAS